ncbi:Der1-like family-domain-containing protein [Penicillium capsulatum]|nr:Der1-like family-domain-containing protein [Penicillium capsulatum]
MDQLQAAFWAAPPVSRTITALALVQSVLVYSGVLSGYYAVFLPGRIFKLFPEIWRVATPFLLTGPNLSFFFDLYFCMISSVLHWCLGAQMLICQQCTTMALRWRPALLGSANRVIFSST